MLKTGRDFLDGLKDGCVVYIGSERADDIVRHHRFQ